MPNYLLLLRGVNVGGHGLLPMAELRRLLRELGYTDVSTYLQSGNALFSADGRDAAAVRAEVEQALARELGLDIRCLVRGREELRQVVERNPLRDLATNPARMLVTFLLEAPDPTALATLDPASVAPDVIAPGEREIYGWYPDGVGRSKLTQAFFEKRLGGIVATARNWKTVTALLQLMGG